MQENRYTLPGGGLTDVSAPSETFCPDQGLIDIWREDLNGLCDKKDLASAMALMAGNMDKRFGPADLNDRRKYRSLTQRSMVLALDWLQTLYVRLEKANRALGAVQVVEYESVMADSDGDPVPGTGTVKCMVYNTDTISDEDARALLERGAAEFDSRVIITDPVTVRSLFPNIVKDDGKNAGDGKEQDG